MATTTLDQNMDKDLEQDRNSEERLHKPKRLAGILRVIVLAAPLFLFLFAILTGLVFGVTMLPLFGYLSLGLALSGGILSIVIALLIFKA